ncbi:glutamate receptor ionotropic, delta-1-like [Centruroides vittatus]|uniref:glutamate receptor ionotropic, delta-1-like n=1 Tax=Centruroides vittatus TaxID=120091 RepID=UPI0035108E76
MARIYKFMKCFRVSSQERQFQIDKDRKPFSLQYLDLLSDCLGISIETNRIYRGTDLALTTKIILKDYMAYTPPVFDTSTYYVIRAARPLDKAISLVKPFAWTIWVCLSITLPLFLISAYVLLRQEARLRNMNPPSFSAFFWIIIRSFLRQDTDIDNVFLETFRLMIGCWLLMTFVLTSGYLGILPSFMMYPGTEDIPKTFMELGKAVSEGRYEPLVFLLSDESTIFNVYKVSFKL